MNQILALAVKDLRLLIRDKAGFFFTFIFPLIYCVFFGTLFGGQKSGSSAIKVLVVDEDQTDSSKAFVAALEKTTEIKAEPAESREKAIDLVRRGERAAFVALPKGFGEARGRMFFGDPAVIETGLDPSRQAEAGMLQGILTKCMFEDMQGLFGNPQRMHEQVNQWMAEIQKADDMNPVFRGALLVFLPSLDRFFHEASKTASAEGSGNFEWQPVNIKSVSVIRERKGPKNPYEVSFPQGMIWGVMGCAAGFGISMVVERVQGTLMRLRVAPLGQVKILAGKAAACFTATAGLQFLNMTIGIVIFGVKPHSWFLLTVAILATSIAFVGIMMLLSTLGKTEQSAGGIGWAVLLIMAMIGGGMVPQFFMPPWLNTLGVISPVRWAILALDGAVWRQFTVAEMALPCVVLVGIGVACFALGARAFRWSEGS